VLEQFYQSGGTTVPVLGTATRHWDNIYVSRYYNWRPGTIKNGYTYVAQYQLKAGAADNAVETLSKSLVVPLLEQQLAAGNIQEYEVDTEAVHSDAPGMFLIVYIANSAEGLDKVNAARVEAVKASPLASPGFGSLVDVPAHRDYLSRTNATYKQVDYSPRSASDATFSLAVTLRSFTSLLDLGPPFFLGSNFHRMSGLAEIASVELLSEFR